MHGRDGQRWRLGGGAARRLLHRLLPFLPRRSPTPEERLLCAICQGRLQRAERWASHPQLAVARPLLVEPHWVPEHCSPTGESSVLCFHCPITPLAAAVSLAAPEVAALRLVRLLAARGGVACLDECWRDHTGRHTALSKALQRGYYTLADFLLSLGTSPDVLATTDLLSSTQFGEEAVAWLINHTAPTAGVVPAWLSNPHLLEQVARDCLLQAERMRRCGASFAFFSQRRVRVTTLITRACTVLLRLSAAGAPPAARPPVPVGAFSDGRWAELNAAATQRLAWGPGTHRHYPRAFRAAMAQLLLVSWVAGFGSSRQGPVGSSTSSGRPQEGVWLDGNLVDCVAAQLGGLQG